MPYSVQLAPQPRKFLAKASKDLKERIQAALGRIGDHPRTDPNIKRLQGDLHDCYRYRVGDYRVIYSIMDASRMVFVEYILHRKDSYR